MEIICDTNIWYKIARDTDKAIKINSKDKLIATFNSIDELSRSLNLLYKVDDIRKAIQSMFKFSSLNAIVFPPFIYLKVISDKKFNYNIQQRHGDILKVTEYIAMGGKIDNLKADEFNQIALKRIESLQIFSDYFNEEANRIKANIKDNKKHLKENSILLNRNFIDYLVSVFTDSNGLPDDFDWNQIELFESVLNVFFKEVEIGAMIIKPNDWFDLSLLIYVNQKRKIWTEDTKWVKLILKANMEKYLYINKKLPNTLQ